MAREWLSLAETAEELGVSPRTIRRWVHSGRLVAELRPGSHGPQYFLETEAVRRLQQARDLAQPGRRVELDRVVEAVAEYLEARDRVFGEQQATLLRELHAAGEELRQAATDLRGVQQAVWQQWQELARTQRVIERLAEDLTAARPGAPASPERGGERPAPQLAAGDEEGSRG